MINEKLFIDIKSEEVFVNGIFKYYVGNELKKEDAEFVEHADTEPLLEECSHFLECIQTRQQPLTNAQSGIEVLKVLHACQQSIEQNGVPVSL